MTNETDLLPTEAIERYLTAHLAGFSGPVQVAKFATGQSNPTFRITTPAARYVLRRKPPGLLLKSAHAVDREFRVMSALQNTDVPVPRTFLMCDDPAVIGAPFYVMAMVEGRGFVDPRVPELGSDAKARARVYDSMNAVLASIHQVDSVATGLGDFGKPGNYYARQIDRWTGQYRASATTADPRMDAIIAWLEENTPEDDGRSSLVHGDYRIDNMIFDRAGSTIRAVLDWELATLGHPFADLAYQCMQWRMPVDAPLQGLAGVDRRSLGIPDEGAYVARYCERMGLAGIENWTFYLVFSFFRLTAILQGVRRRAMDGNASNPEQARRFARMIPDLTRRAKELIS